METSQTTDPTTLSPRVVPERFRPTTHYQVLGVDKVASPTEIRHAYFRLKSVYSSGNQALYSLISDDELVATVTRIENAFNVLNNAASRSAYDREIGVAPTIGELPVLPENVVPTEPTRPEVRKPFVPSSLNPVTDKGMMSEPAGKAAHMSAGPRIRGVALAVSQPQIRATIDRMISEATVVDGALLKALRLAVGVSAEEMQLNTKISLGVLASMEADRRDELPQGAYARGYVKSFLRYVGFDDSRELVDSYFQRTPICKRLPNQ